MVAELGTALKIAKEVGSVDKLLSTIMNIDYLFKDNLSKRRLRKVIEQLEYIYFSRNGVRRALEMIRDKEIKLPNQRDTLIDATQRFYDDNPSAYETVSGLTDFFNSAELRHDEDFTEIGRSIIYVKTAVRDAIWEMFNELDENKFSEQSVDDASQQAADVLKSIQTLNDAIRLVYQKLNS